MPDFHHGLLVLAWLVASGSGSFTAPGELSRADQRFYVTSRGSALVDSGIAAAAPAGEDAAAFEAVPPPGVRMRADEARATSTPWVDSNAWRFQRGLGKANYQSLPAGAAPLAAAEAFTFNASAILDPDPADLEELGNMLQFLKAHELPPLPSMANIGVVDNDSRLMGEVLNLLTRRNLLYRVVTEPDPALDVTVRLGSEEFPLAAAADPSQFAARVRAKLGDDKRLVRLYGTSTIIARLAGDGNKARLYLLNYRQGRESRGGWNLPSVRVRVLGRYQPRFAGYGAAPSAALTDIEHVDGATEFWVPNFMILAIIDLDVVK